MKLKKLLTYYFLNLVAINGHRAMVRAQEISTLCVTYLSRMHLAQVIETGVNNI